MIVVCIWLLENKYLSIYLSIYIQSFKKRITNILLYHYVFTLNNHNFLSGLKQSRKIDPDR